MSTLAPAEAPVAAATPSTCNFNSQELKKYKDLEDSIFQINSMQAESKLSDSSMAARALTAQLEADKKHLHTTINAEQKEDMLLDKYQNHYGCCAFFLGQKNKEGKIAQHMELQQKYETQHKVEAQMIFEGEQSLAKTQEELHYWQSKVSQLNAAKAEQSSLLNTMFSRPPWTSDPVHAPLVLEVASLKNEASKARVTAEIYHTAANLLVSALGLCNQAVQLLQQAGWLGRFEMGMDFGMCIMDPRFGFERQGMFGEMIQMMEIEQANALVQQAAQRINQAHTTLPTMPFIEQAIVHNCMSGIFVDILFGNFLSEMIIIQQVHASMARVGSMMQQVQQCANWCTSNQRGFTEQLQSFLAKAADRDQQVLAFRRQHLQNALEH